NCGPIGPRIRRHVQHWGPDRGARGRCRGGNRWASPLHRPDQPARRKSSAVCRAAQISRAMLTKRIIPCLDVDRGRVVKGITFVGLRDAGDPVELAEVYNGEGADELVFYDITASSD